MKMLRFLALPVGIVLSAVAAQADQLSLGQISNYLNSLKMAEAEFTQINDDQTISTGKIYIRRPGRIRFEYDPPEASLVLASRGRVAVFDAKSNQPPEQFPLVKTPLNLILARNIDLTRDRMVVDHRSEGPATTVTAQDPQRPEYGQIKLVFTADPIELRQWVVTDGTGGQTTVILGELKRDVNLRLDFFDIEDEIEARGL